MAITLDTENPFAQHYANLADPRLGAEAIEASDEFFATKDRMLNPNPPVFIADKFDDHGKWMDGWETRRKREAGYDWCVVRLGLPGTITGVEIDTRHFTGNFPPAASLEACRTSGKLTARTKWTQLLSSVELEGDKRHFFEINDGNSYSHVRMNIYPDGGVARLRVYGLVERRWTAKDKKTQFDLASVINGARTIGCSNQHYGTPLNMLMPDEAKNMGDGWETGRRRIPGNEWAIIALGAPGRLRKVVVDTAFFKGNFPDRCSILAAHVEDGTKSSLTTQSMFWPTLLPEQNLSANSEHTFQPELVDLGPVTHVRFNIIPDGGVSRLHLFGTIA
jgi:allantoicase